MRITTAFTWALIVPFSISISRFPIQCGLRPLSASPTARRGVYLSVAFQFSADYDSDFYLGDIPVTFYQSLSNSVRITTLVAVKGAGAATGLSVAFQFSADYDNRFRYFFHFILFFLSVAFQFSADYDHPFD